MSTRRPPGDPGRASGEGAGAETVAGLARELDGLRRELDPLAGVPSRVDDLARAVAQLADAVAAMSGAAAPSAPTPPPSWLVCPTDREVTRRLLDDLTVWLHTVFLRYPDGAGSLPECWLWHPDIVEELLWLMHAWIAAYQGRGASVQNVGDWHDRQRPGVVRRIRAQHASCSRESHQQRPGWTTVPTGATPVPGRDAVDSIAAWWATDRDQPAPEPATDHSRDSTLGDALNGRTNGAGAGPAAHRPGAGGTPW